jgi:hypothetical protein
MKKQQAKEKKGIFSYVPRLSFLPPARSLPPMAV